MRALLTQLRWQFLILHKNRLIAISIVVTITYALIFYFIKDLPNVDRFLTLLIYNDPVVIGLFFIGLSVILEKNDDVLPALFATPLSHHMYLLSRVLSLSLLGWACAAGMTLALLGPNIAWFHFSTGVFGTCILFSLAGIFVVSYTTEFLGFMLRSIPVMILLSLPLLNYFELTDVAIFRFMPVQGALNLIVSSLDPSIEVIPVYLSFFSLFLWIPLLYFGVYRIFVRRIVNAS
jgi:fluoroquinolone transport system permease protein